MLSKKTAWSALVIAATMAGCGGDAPADDNSGGSGTGASGNGGSGIGASGTGGASGSTNVGQSGTGGTGGTGGMAGTGGVAGGGTAGAPEAMIDDSLSAQFPEVTDWHALELIYPISHSGYDGVHTFKLPMRARCTPLPLTAWHSEPATAVAFDADPDNANGVMITIVEPVVDIMIAAVDGARGGQAELHVTVGTPEQWTLGETRYTTGSDWKLDILAPTAPPPDTKCTVCHSPNSSSGFDVAHTPTQCARISDEGMTQIMTTGSKPADVPFRVLPPTIDFAGMTYTDVELYKEFHLWDTTDDALKGMILYLRSLTPAGQGCVNNPLTGQCEDVEADPNAECM